MQVQVQVRFGVFDGFAVTRPEEYRMDRIDAQFATDPDGLVVVVDDRDEIVAGPADPADPDAWSGLAEFVRGYILDGR